MFFILGDFSFNSERWIRYQELPPQHLCAWALVVQQKNSIGKVIFLFRTLSEDVIEALCLFDCDLFLIYCGCHFFAVANLRESNKIFQLVFWKFIDAAAKTHVFSVINCHFCCDILTNLVFEKICQALFMKFHAVSCLNYLV